MAERKRSTNSNSVLEVKYSKKVISSTVKLRSSEGGQWRELALYLVHSGLAGSKRHDVDVVHAARRLQEANPVAVAHFASLHLLNGVDAAELVPNLATEKKIFA